MTQPDNADIKGPKVEDPPQEEPTVSSRGRKAPVSDRSLIFFNPRLAEAYRQDFAPKAKDKTNHERSE